MDIIKANSGKYLIKFNKRIPDQKIQEMQYWCDKNCNNTWKIKPIGALFESEKDVMAFRLRFI